MPTELAKRITTVNPAARPNCIVYVRNAVPMSRGATVLAIGVHFHVRKSVAPLGTSITVSDDSLVGPIRYTLMPGETAQFVNNDPRFWVSQVTAAVLVRFGTADLLHLPKDLPFESAPIPLPMIQPPQQFIEIQFEFRAKRLAPSAANDAATCFELIQVP